MIIRIKNKVNNIMQNIMIKIRRIKCNKKDLGLIKI